MNLNEFKDTLIAKQKEMETYIKTEASRTMKSYFDEVFNKHPELNEIFWTQYTPYFNDGDECVFRVHDAGVRFTNSDGVKKETDYISDYEVRNGNLTQGLLLTMKEFNCVITSKEMKPVFKMLFGDHMEIIVNREGITAEECSHD